MRAGKVLGAVVSLLVFAVPIRSVSAAELYVVDTDIGAIRVFDTVMETVSV